VKQRTLAQLKPHSHLGSCPLSRASPARSKEADLEGVGLCRPKLRYVRNSLRYGMSVGLKPNLWTKEAQLAQPVDRHFFERCAISQCSRERERVRCWSTQETSQTPWRLSPTKSISWETRGAQCFAWCRKGPSRSRTLPVCLAQAYNTVFTGYGALLRRPLRTYAYRTVTHYTAYDTNT